MFLYKEIILVIFISISDNVLSMAVKMIKYSSLPAGKVTKPVGDVMKSLQVRAKEDCLLHCHGSDRCTSWEVSSSNGEYSCTLREIFSTDPVNQVHNSGVTSYILGNLFFIVICKLDRFI